MKRSGKKEKSFLIKSVLVIVLIFAVVGVLAYSYQPKEDLTALTNYLFDNVEDKIYPNYKIYHININPPNLEVKRIASMAADEKGFCVSCVARLLSAKQVSELGSFYNYPASSYTEGQRSAGISWIENGPTAVTQGLNDFTYFIAFDGIKGNVKEISVTTDPPESEFKTMSLEEVKNFNHLYEEISVSATYPELTGKNEYCFWIQPWQLSHNIYYITVPNGMTKYNVIDKGKCDVTVNKNVNKINILADCKSYYDLCPGSQQEVDGKVKCDFPKITVCFN
jgi:hypothetical protein